VVRTCAGRRLSVLRQAFRRLEDLFLVLADRLSDRPDLQIPSVASSLLFHGAMILVLGFVAVQARSHHETRLDGDLYRPDLEDFQTLDTQALAEIEDTKLRPVEGSFGPKLGDVIVQAPAAVKGIPPSALAIAAPQLSRVGSLLLPQAAILDKTVSIRGTGAEHTGDVEGAVDRIAVEILRRLEKGRTLVIWAFDASGSLYHERQRLDDYIQKVYRHIEDYDRERLASEGGLLTAVVSFGQERRILTKEPTGDLEAIKAAISSVHLDESGIEMTFSTVAEIARRYGRYHRNGERYQTMTVVVTDEVGEDESQLENAIAQAREASMPVFVLGSPALFGRVEGYMNYTDPKSQQTFFNLPVRQGPESVVLETIHLPFWYDGPQHEMLDAGFGPYALSRLASATGGIYFITRLHPNRELFNPANMREYRPDWVSREQYMMAIGRNPLRQAVMNAALITQQRLPGQPSMMFPAAESPEFKETMARNQEVVARVQYTVDEALQVIHAVTDRRDHETSRRWKAHFDLVRGRLLTMHLRCLEYNLACARMKKDAPKFTRPNSNAWRLVPHSELALKDKGEKSRAEEARQLLDRVLTDHPDTPWAKLAARELAHPLGLQWVETYVPPPPPRRESDDAAAARNRNNRAPSPPPVVPKL
jgi:hypothetical protein